MREKKLTNRFIFLPVHYPSDSRTHLALEKSGNDDRSRTFSSFHLSELGELDKISVEGIRLLPNIRLFPSDGDFQIFLAENDYP